MTSVSLGKKPVNPDLLQAGSNTTGVNKLEALTPPLPTVIADTKAYVSSIPYVSFHREDGKKLAFVNGLFETSIKADQEYLDAQIAYGNPYISEATTDQVYAAKLQVDPEAAVRQRIEAQLRSEIEAQIRAELTHASTNKLNPTSTNALAGGAVSSTSNN